LRHEFVIVIIDESWAELFRPPCGHLQGLAVAWPVKEGRVTLEVHESISIGFGIILRPGAYVGKRGRSTWTGAEYLVELTADEATSLGGTVGPGVDTTVYDVSRFVRSGKIGVF
jgi:hypothetical protein